VRPPPRSPLLPYTTLFRSTQSGESRVAATPETVKRYIALGATVAVEAGAGERSYLADEAYREAGATIATDRSSLLKDADVVLAVRRPYADDIAMMKAGAAGNRKSTRLNSSHVKISYAVF